MWYNGFIIWKKSTEKAMKTKKLLSIFAATLLSATALFGCTASDTKIEFKNNWLKDPLLSQTSLTETLCYDVTFEKSAGSNTLKYAFGYENGSYTTTLTKRSTEEFDYTTKLTIDVVYSWNGETITLQDTVETSVHFISANDGLTPIKSTKTILSHSPVNATEEVSALNKCYNTSHYSIETTYADGKGTAKIQENPDIAEGEKDYKAPKTLTFNMGKKLSYLDNEQLLLGLRAFDSSTTSGTVQSYAPFEGGMQKISLSFNSKKQSKELNVAVTENSQAKEIKLFEYRTATIALKATNSGADKTAWVATENRNVILRLEHPLPFNFGTMVYSLKSIDRTES